VRDAGERELLFRMDSAIQRLAETGGDESARISLVGTYHNLLRKWSDT
jgi:PKHD-type hydroxylase